MSELDPWIDAYRATHGRARAPTTDTRARVLATARTRTLRRSYATVGLAIAALFVTNATTWAWASGALSSWIGSAKTDRARVAGPPTVATDAEVAAERARGRDRATREEARARIADPRLARGSIDRTPRVAARLDPQRTRQPPAVALRGEATGAIAAARRTLAPPRRDRERASSPTVARADACNPETIAPAAPEPSTAEILPASAPEPAALEQALAELEPLMQTGDDADRRAFESAHRTHFGGASAPVALAAWDRYLGAYPEGRFAPEARFNRAVTLLRLGRIGEARESLAPFASGAFRGLRRLEAQRLIEAIDQGRIRAP